MWLCIFDSVDLEMPVFTFCPTDLTLYLRNVGDTSVVPSWDIPVATDNAGTPNITSNYSGQALDVNTTTLIVYTAEDSSGNQATCSFRVTIASKFITQLLIYNQGHIQLHNYHGK